MSDIKIDTRDMRFSDERSDILIDMVIRSNMMRHDDK